MSETIYIDLSAKLEQWNLPSAVAFANGRQGVIWVSKRVKKSARDWLKVRYPNRHSTFYIYLLFATFIYLAIRPYLTKIKHIQIDRDYTGQKSERFIKDFLLTLLQRDQPKLRGNFVAFRAVKGSKADRLARNVFKGTHSADRKITLGEITEVLAK